VAGAAVGSLARWLPAQAAKASTAAMAKAASPPIRGVCLVLRDPPVVASAPDLLSTVCLSEVSDHSTVPTWHGEAAACG